MFNVGVMGNDGTEFQEFKNSEILNTDTTIHSEETKEQENEEGINNQDNNPNQTKGTEEDETKTVDADAELKVFKRDLNNKAEKLIKSVIPQRIIEISKLIERFLQDKDCIRVQQPVNIFVSERSVNQNRKKGYNHLYQRSCMKYNFSSRSSKHSLFKEKVIEESIPSNKILISMMKLLKPFVMDLVSDTDTLKIWLTLTIPKYSDINYFDDKIQHTIIDKIGLIEKYALEVFNCSSLCSLQRAEIVTKVATFPHISDYRKAVMETDENSYRYLFKMMCQIRDMYYSLHTVLVNNYDDIRNPSNGNLNTMCS